MDADKTLDSIFFHGILGEKEKSHVISYTSIGIPNPSARTETFGISSTDFQKMGVPVIVKAKNGLLDTIAPNVTAATFTFNFQLKYKIVSLLKNKRLMDNLGQAGPNFVYKKFNPEKLINEWNELFENLYNSSTVRYKHLINFPMNNFKLVRLINSFLRFKINLRFLPSVITIESYIWKFKTRIFTK
jgi:hypothetical protein